MAGKKKGLSRGLDTLLPDFLEDVLTAKPKKVKTKVETGVAVWDLDKLSPSTFQPRKNINKTDLDALAASIKSQGILQPIVIRALKSGKAEIIAGERRWHAAKLAGLKQIPVVIKELSDTDCMAVALIENMQREDLNIIDEAMAIDKLAKEFDLTHQQIATSLGKSRSAITNALRLLVLPKEVKDLLLNGSLEAGHGKVLLGLPQVSQTSAARLVVERQLSVRETESLVLNMLEDKPKPVKVKLDPNIKKLETSLVETLGSKVALQHSKSGKGKIVVYYNDLDELDGILAHIK